jgi:prepilin peptidase CpaA
MWGILAIGVYAAALAGAGASDLVRYEIPNLASLLLVGAFFLVAPALPIATVLTSHVAAGALVFLIGALAFSAGIFGGGDAKLLAATSLWMGWRHLAVFFLLTALAGAALALALLAARRLADCRPELRRGHWYSRLLSNDEGVPYGVAIAASGLFLLSQLGTTGLAAEAVN